jgi:hypothetical protein
LKSLFDAATAIPQCCGTSPFFLMARRCRRFTGFAIRRCGLQSEQLNLTAECAKPKPRSALRSLLPRMPHMQLNGIVRCRPITLALPHMGELAAPAKDSNASTPIMPIGLLVAMTLLGNGQTIGSLSAISSPLMRRFEWSDDGTSCGN